MIRILIFVFKRARRDLNPRPSGPEPDALSTELRALNLCQYSTPIREFAPRVSLTLLLGIGNPPLSQRAITGEDVKDKLLGLLVHRLYALQSGGGDR